jgi:hypothetical protein
MMRQGILCAVMRGECYYQWQAAAITVGSRVATNANLNIRSSASSGNQAWYTKVRSQGTVIGGPTTASGYTWWQVDFDTGVDGWV